MAYTVPTTEPAALRAGDTWQWTRVLGDYPADAWTLTYYFRNAAAHFNVVAAADGTAYAVNVVKATTAARTAGWYDWAAFVSSATERYQVDAGRTEVLPDLSAAAAYDGRTFARKMLDAIEAALLSRATTDQLDMIEAAYEARKIRRGEGGLLKLRDSFRAEVAVEDRARRGVRSNRILAVG